jgi:hypothetical protein
MEQFWPSCTMDRTIDTATTQERCVCCIDDSVDVKFRYVTFKDTQNKQGLAPWMVSSKLK